jgi:hypothetical protein
MRETRNAYKILMGKIDGERLLERYNWRLVDIITTDAMEVSFKDGRWRELAQKFCPTADFGISGDKLSGSATDG